MPPTIRLSLCGDVMTGRGVDQILPHPSDPAIHERWMSSAIDYVRLAEKANGVISRPVGYDYIWGEALGAWREADARVVNLETAVTTSDSPLPKGINYRMNPQNVCCLSAAGVDCCVLANNHVLDWGVDGLRETLDTLRAAGIATAGAGMNIAEATAPAIVEVPGKGRVLVFAIATPSSGAPLDWAATDARPGVNLADLSEATVLRLADQIASERRPDDVVVVSTHWGPNWGYDIPPEHRRFARALIDTAGASVVHGHSAHHPLAAEVHAGRLILYGCGDFVSDYEGIGGYAEYRNDLSLLYLADLEAGGERLLALDLIPFQVRRMRLERTCAADTAWMAMTLGREYARFGLGIGRAASALSLVGFSREARCA